MATLKECSRYANFIQTNIDKIHNMIRGGLNASMYSSTELHKKSSANKDFVDETIKTEYENTYDLTIEQVSDLLESLLYEKFSLSTAINEGKKNMFVTVHNTQTGIDTALEYTKALRNSSVYYYNILGQLKDSKKKEMTNGFMINVEGNQVGFRYEVEKETKLNFDRNTINAKNKELKMIADDISIKVDEMMSSDKIDFVPQFNYLDTFEEFLENNKK